MLLNLNPPPALGGHQEPGGAPAAVGTRRCPERQLEQIRLLIVVNKSGAKGQSLPPSLPPSGSDDRILSWMVDVHKS